MDSIRHNLVGEKKRVIILNLLEVVVCGNNQFVDGVAASLIADGRSRVTRSGRYLPDVVWELGMVCPDIVIFEIGSDNKVPDPAFFSGYPAVKFIGINAKDSVMAVFFDKGQKIVNADNLEMEIKEMVGGRNN